MSSVGSTFLLCTIVFVIIIVVVGLVLFLTRRCNFSEKAKERLNNIKKAIFFNSIIRYTFLSANKLNMSSMMALKGTTEEVAGVNEIVPIVILTIISTVGIVYARVLHKNRGVLDTD